MKHLSNCFLKLSGHQASSHLDPPTLLSPSLSHLLLPVHIHVCAVTEEIDALCWALQLLLGFTLWQGPLQFVVRGAHTEEIRQWDYCLKKIDVTKLPRNKTKGKMDCVDSWKGPLSVRPSVRLRKRCQQSLYLKIWVTSLQDSGAHLIIWKTSVSPWSHTWNKLWLTQVVSHCYRPYNKNKNSFI